MIQIHILILSILGLAFGFGIALAGNNTVEEGKPAPDFTLTDQDDKTHTLSDYKGHWVLLYFYPRDNTPGCTVEACTFRDQFSDFRKIKLVVFGISTDTIEKHQKFSKKYNLPFSLLSDPDANIAQKYGAKKQDAIRALRKSFLINPDGIVVKIYNKVTPADHPEQILRDFKEFSN